MLVDCLGDLAFAVEHVGSTFKDDYPPYHLYACPKDSAEPGRHPADREAYGRMKMQLAERFPTGIDGYMAGKHDWIQNVLARIAR